jgi:hypothetical protein
MASSLSCDSNWILMQKNINKQENVLKKLTYLSDEWIVKRVFSMFVFCMVLVK